MRNSKKETSSPCVVTLLTLTLGVFCGLLVAVVAASETDTPPDTVSSSWFTLHKSDSLSYWSVLRERIVKFLSVTTIALVSDMRLRARSLFTLVADVKGYAERLFYKLPALMQSMLDLTQHVITLFPDVRSCVQLLFSKTEHLLGSVISSVRGHTQYFFAMAFEVIRILRDHGQVFVSNAIEAAQDCPPFVGVCILGVLIGLIFMWIEGNKPRLPTEYRKPMEHETDEKVHEMLFGKARTKTKARAETKGNKSALSGNSPAKRAQSKRWEHKDTKHTKRNKKYGSWKLFQKEFTELRLPKNQMSRIHDIVTKFDPSKCANGSNPWNQFQRRLKGHGLAIQERAQLYKFSKRER